MQPKLNLPDKLFMRVFLASLLFFASLDFAQWYTMRSWNGLVYIYVGEKRAPSSVRSVNDYSGIDHRALYRSVHEQLMTMAKVFKRDGQVGVRLGHPLLPNSDSGGRAFACEVPGHAGVFERMELTFYGTGITDSGEPAHLVIDTNCQASDHIDSLETVWIPMQEIVDSHAHDQELQIPGEHEALVRLQNIPDQWPENWVLWSVRFYHPDAPDEALVVDSEHLHKAMSASVSFDWTVQR